MKVLKKQLRNVIVFALILGQLSIYCPDTLAKGKVVKLNRKSYTLTVGKTVKLKLLNTKKKVKWSSSKKSIAVVSKKGLVKAIKKGKAVITAKCSNKKYTCRITVQKRKNISSAQPTAVPTGVPTFQPTQAPPTSVPSSEPSEPSQAPSPTSEPTAEPSQAPSPTSQATAKPTGTPTDKPSPTPQPTIVPTPDVTEITMEQIEKWNENNDAFDVTYHDDNKVSFISGQVYSKPVKSEEEAYKAVSALKKLDGADDINLCYLQTDVDWNGDIYYRYNQYVKGYIIPNCLAILGTDAEGNTISYSNNLLSDTNDIDAHDLITAEEAVEIVKATDAEYIEEALSVPYMEITEIYETPIFSWSVIGKNPLFLESDFEYPYIKYSVDAHSGELILACELPSLGNLTTEEAMGNSNAFINVDTELMEFTDIYGNKVSLPVARTEDGQYYVIDTKRKIMTYNYLDDDASLMHNNLHTFAKAEDLSPAFVSCINNIIQIYDYYEKLGYKSTDGKGKNSISIYLGYKKDGKEYENAAFLTSTLNESRFVFSDYESMAVFDIAAHEYAHAIQANFAKCIEYDHLSGAIMESYADIVGNLLQMSMFDEKQCDKELWAIGEMSGTVTDSALRFMGDPYAGDQPKYVGDMYWVSNVYISAPNDYSGVHINSSVLNYICYSLFKNKNQSFTYQDYLAIWFSTAYITVNTTDYNDYRAYVKYSMRRHNSSSDQKAIDEVFEEANCSKVNTDNWDYDLKENCSYINFDQTECKQDEFLSIVVVWKDANGVTHNILASDKNDIQVAMVPNNTDYTIVYYNVAKNNTTLYFMKARDNVSVAEKDVELIYDRDKLYPEYTNNAAWAIRPSSAEFETEAKADVFFINPTAVIGSETELNMEMYDEANRESFLNAINMEKGIYDTNTHFFAPYYRQQTLKCLELYGVDNIECKNTALFDVTNAFKEFLNIHEEGTPIILAGFSQGSQLLQDILIEFNDNDKFKNDYLASYAIGWNFSDEFLETYPFIKMAQGEKDTGVVVSFCSEAEDYKGSSIIVPENVHTNGINPLNWKTDSTVADKSENIGACFMNGDIVENEVPGLCGAYLDPVRGTLKVTGILTDDYPAKLDLFENGNFHIYDYQFFYRNLQQNVQTRIASRNSK